MQKLNIDTLRDNIESQYPTPIASVFYKYRMLRARDDDIGGLHKGLVDLFEVFFRYIAIVSIQEAVECIPGLRGKLPQKEKTFEFLKRPSLGHWVGIVRTLSKLKDDYRNSQWSDPIFDWYLQGRHEQSSNALAQLASIDGLKYESRTKTPVAEICNAMVTYRNKQLGHGAGQRAEVIRQRLPALEDALLYIIGSASFMKDMYVINAEKIEVKADNLYLVQGDRLAGISVKDYVQFTTTFQLAREKVYLIRKQENERPVTSLSLSPFILWKLNEQTNHFDSYLFNDVQRTHIEYISFTSGDTCYEKEVSDEFQKIVKFELKSRGEEQEDLYLSVEEKMERAENLYKMGLLLFEQEHFEDALETLEKSLTYNRRYDTLFEIAKILHMLNEPMEKTMQVIDKCLMICPEGFHEPADFKLMLEMEIVHRQGFSQVLDYMSITSRWTDNDMPADMIDNVDNENDPNSESVGMEEKEQTWRVAVPTLFHALTPPLLRKRYTTHWWVFLLTAWYVANWFVEKHFIGYVYDYSVAKLIEYSICMTILITILSVRQKLLGIHEKLYRQLFRMREQRFKKWYFTKLKYIFGNYEFHDKGTLDFRGVYSKQSGYIIFFTVFLLVLCTILMLIDGQLQQGPGAAYYADMSLKRFVDHLIFYGFIVIYATVVVRITGMIYTFSRLSLKPMLSKMIIEGIRTFDSIMVQAITTSVVLFFLFSVGEAYIQTWVVGKEFTFDEIIIGAICSMVILVWTIRLPVSLYTAALKSKFKAIHSYSRHVESAFDSFLDNPTDELKLDEYHKLLKNRGLLKKLPTWPLSVVQTATIFGANVFMFVIAILFYLTRTGRIFG